MKTRQNIILIAAVLFCDIPAYAITLKSPNGKICADIPDNNTSITIYHNTKGKKTKVMRLSEVGLVIDGKTNKGQNGKEIGKKTSVKADYIMPVGKKRHCTNKANEYDITLKGDGDNDLTLKLRLYNDGVAFCYKAENLSSSTINDDLTTYVIDEGTPRWIQKYNESYEDFFPCVITGEGKDHRWGYPTLVECGNGVYALISEAGIEKQHSASWLQNDKNATDYKVCLGESQLKHSGTYQSPWRLMITGDLSDIVESTLVTDLSAPCRLDNTSWIAPGSVSWIYWAYNHGSRDYQIIKKYIDMAETLNLPYVLIDAEWDEMSNGGDINDALSYAKQKGVKTMIWYNSSTAWVNNGAPGPYYRLNKPEDREKEFKWLEDNGVAGVKIDFFAGDTQSTMEYCIELLESAARHNLMVNFHGATIPRGWQRTYPNLMSVEGVYGAEWYNNLPVLTNKAAAHNCTLPFTRNVIGPMDYTPVTFSDSQHPHITSDAHELALAVLYESALLHWADRPESYLAQPDKVQSFMTELPTVWDETRYIAGYPGDHVVLARRKGDTWWIAGINGKDEEREITIDLSPLKIDKKANVTIYADGDGWDIKEYNGSLPTNYPLKARGGFVIVAKK